MNLRLLLLLAVVGLLSACARPMEVKSHASDRTSTPDKLLVVQKTFYAVPKPKESNPFKAEFSRLMGMCGVPTAFSVNAEERRKSLFAEEKPLPGGDVDTDKIAELNPGFTMLVRETERTTQGTVTTVDITATVTDLARKKEIWRGSGYIRKTPLLNQVTLEDLARGFAESMRKDGLLPSCPAQFSPSPKN